MSVYLSGYVVERKHGEYLSDPSTNGTGHSFTRSVTTARLFATYEAARAQCCDFVSP